MWVFLNFSITIWYLDRYDNSKGEFVLLAITTKDLTYKQNFCLAKLKKVAALLFLFVCFLNIYSSELQNSDICAQQKTCCQDVLRSS